MPTLSRTYATPRLKYVLDVATWAEPWECRDIRGRSSMILGINWGLQYVNACRSIAKSAYFVLILMSTKLRYVIRTTTIWWEQLDSSQFLQQLLVCNALFLALRKLLWSNHLFDPQVWNTRPGGLVVFAPPCCSWVFLSRSVTKRSWANPEGDTTNRSVILTNIFVRRMLYMYLGSNVGMIDRFFFAI